MRIVAGEWRGRRLAAPKGDATRPTADRTRETLFNMLVSRLGSFEGLNVADLFAGSGALGLEALSRGARSAEFVERHPASLRALGANLAALGAGDAAVVHRADVLRFLAGLPREAFDVAFADPPYHQELARAVAERWAGEPFARVLGIEHEAGEAMPPGGATRRNGSTAVTINRLAEA